MKDTDKFFVPVKTKDEKLASIDSSIDSCIKILKQELTKRNSAVSGWDDYVKYMSNHLKEFEQDFNFLRDQTR